MPNNSDWRRLYSFQSNYVQIDDRRYHYVDEGEGPILLMVHGNPTWSFYWRELIRGLRDQFRVIAVDHIGCGLSDQPKRYPYSLEHHTRNLREFIEKLDLQNITLVAHDWGGAIGLGAAVQQQQRFGRFVLFNTGAFPPWYIPLRIRVCRTPVLGRIAIQGLNLFARAALWMAVEKRDRMTGDVASGLLAPYDSWGHRTAIYRFVKDIPWRRKHPTFRTLAELEARLPELHDQPMLFVWGMRDWCFRPDCLDRFLEIFPNAEVERIEDGGHYVVEDAYERIIPRVKQFAATRPLGAVAATG